MAKKSSVLLGMFEHKETKKQNW